MQMFQKPGKAGQQQNQAQQLMHMLASIMTEIAGCQEGAVIDRPEEVASATFTASDIPMAKVQGVRATKACTWMSRPSTPSEVMSAIVSTHPVAELSAWFLRGQKLKTWPHKDPSMRDLVNLATERYSPASRCVHEIVHILQTGMEGPLAIFDGSLVGT